MITKPVWMLQYQERCMYNDQSIHNCTIPTGGLLIKLQGLSRARDKKPESSAGEHFITSQQLQCSHGELFTLPALLFQKSDLYGVEISAERALTRPASGSNFPAAAYLLSLTCTDAGCWTGSLTRVWHGLHLLTNCTQEFQTSLLV